MILMETFGNGVKVISNLSLVLENIIYTMIFQEDVLIKNTIYYWEELGPLLDLTLVLSSELLSEDTFIKMLDLDLLKKSLMTTNKKCTLTKYI